MALPHLVDRVELGNICVEQQYAHHVGERGSGGLTSGEDEKCGCRGSRTAEDISPSRLAAINAGINKRSPAFTAWG